MKVQLSCRVDPRLKEKLYQVYGNYTIVEHLIEEHLSQLQNPNLIRNIELEEEVKEQILFLEGQYAQMETMLKNIELQLQEQQTRLTRLEETSQEMVKSIENVTTKDLKDFKGSLKVVTKKLEENKALRERLGCYPPIQRSKLQPYAKVAGVSLDKLLEHIDPQLYECIEN